MSIEKYVAKYGEANRKVIQKALEWLAIQEPNWHLEKPIDEAKFIEDLVANSFGQEVDRFSGEPT